MYKNCTVVFSDDHVQRLNHRVTIPDKEQSAQSAEYYGRKKNESFSLGSPAAGWTNTQGSYTTGTIRRTIKEREIEGDMAYPLHGIFDGIFDAR